ncbi:MAG: peptidylprolyl isomerase, partial [Thermoguttaceae bacterium]|nr:peptidylprolyl isomerase [Thermoguttaceae bacterium]
YDIAKEDPKMLRDFETNQEVPVSYSIMNLLPKYRKLWEDEKAARVKDATKNLPQVLLHTNKGDIVLELFKDEAPNAVGNFLTLVQQGYYTDCPFHRVLPHFMAQGGDPTGTGTGGPGYCIPCECDKPDARMHFRGSISMAHAGRDTGGSQFFLTFVPTDHLNGVHTVFGRVVQGMEVLADLQRIDPESETQPAPDKILEARIIRGEPFEFKKLPSNR